MCDRVVDCFDVVSTVKKNLLVTRSADTACGFESLIQQLKQRLFVQPAFQLRPHSSQLDAGFLATARDEPGLEETRPVVDCGGAAAAVVPSAIAARVSGAGNSLGNCKASSSALSHKGEENGN